MRNEKPSREQRQTFRCAVADVRQQCELKVGPRVLPATLLDESAGGFSVSVEGPIELAVDDKVDLHTDAGWFVARVVHMVEIDTPKDGATEADACKPRFRLGLARLGEWWLPGPSTGWLLGDRLRSSLRKWHSSSGMPLVFGVLLAVVAVATPMLLIGSYWNFQVSPSKLPSSSNSDFVTEPRAPSKSWRSPKPDAKTSRQPVTEPIASSKSSHRSLWPLGDASPVQNDGGTTAASSGQGLRGASSYLPGAGVFAIPDVVRQLQLTADQQEQIDALIAASAKAIHDLNQLAPDRQRQQMAKLRTQLLDDARRKALELLTSQQRTEWDKLSNAQRPVPGS